MRHRPDPDNELSQSIKIICKHHVYNMRILFRKLTYMRIYVRACSPSLNLINRHIYINEMCSNFMYIYMKLEHISCFVYAHIMKLQHISFIYVYFLNLSWESMRVHIFGYMSIFYIRYAYYKHDVCILF